MVVGLDMVARQRWLQADIVAAEGNRGQAGGVDVCAAFSDAHCTVVPATGQLSHEGQRGA